MPSGIPKKGHRTMGAAERRAQRPATIDPNQYYSIPEAAAARDESPSTFWKHVAEGRVSVVKFGKRTKVLGAEIIRSNGGTIAGPEPALEQLVEKLRALGYEIESPDVRQAVEKLRALGYIIKEPRMPP